MRPAHKQCYGPVVLIAMERRGQHESQSSAEARTTSSATTAIVPTLCSASAAAPTVRTQEVAAAQCGRWKSCGVGCRKGQHAASTIGRRRKSALSQRAHSRAFTATRHAESSGTGRSVCHLLESGSLRPLGDSTLAALNACSSTHKQRGHPHHTQSLSARDTSCRIAFLCFTREEVHRPWPARDKAT